MILTAQNISWHGILHDISIKIMPRSWTHIIGPNGAGKSSLLKILSGLEEPAGGDIFLDDKTLKSISFLDRAHAFAYVPQRLEALPEITVEQFMEQSQFSSRRLEIEADEILELTGLVACRDKRLTTLSGGELQRAMIAAAIAQNTPIILLDEPTSALDIAQTLHINSLLRKLIDEGKTIVTVTHDLPSASETADFTILMNRGGCVWQGKGFPPAQNLSEVYELPVSHFDQLPDKIETHSNPLDTDKCVIDNPSTSTPPKPDTIDDCAPSKRRLPRWFFALIALILIIMIAPFIGSSLINILNLSDQDRFILMQLRIPRVLWGAASGAALACVGATLQAMLQNPLATPYTLGIASGASLGAMIAIALGVSSLLFLASLSFISAVLTFMCILFITAKFGFKTPTFCLLAGVAASIFCSSIALVLQALSTPLTAHQMMRWQMGGLDVVGYNSTLLIPLIFLCIAALARLSEPLNLIAVDASLAQTRGVNVTLTRKLTLLLTSLATAFVVCICGPISFVGLLIPMWLRHKYGADLRKNLPLCVIYGAMFILSADTLARLLETIAPLPVGVLVSIIGIPAIFFSFRFSKSL